MTRSLIAMLIVSMVLPGYTLGPNYQRPAAPTLGVRRAVS